MSKTYSAGIVTAYGAAKRAGYTGTYEDFCRQQAGYAGNAAAVEQAKTDAINAKNDAISAKNDAVSAKDDAVSAKNTAVSAKDDAVSAKNTASTKAQEASASATSAGLSATSASQSAQNAEQSAQGVSGSLAQIQTNKEDIDTLKADLDDNVNDLKSAVDNLEYKVLPNKVRTKTIATTSGTSIVSSTHVFDETIPANTSFTIRINDNDSTIGIYNLYWNGSVLQYNCVTNTNYTFTKTSAVNYISIYCNTVAKTGSIEAVLTYKVNDANIEDAVSLMSVSYREELEKIPEKRNLFDKTAITEGKYVNASTGELANGYNATDYIPVRGGVTYYAAIIEKDRCALYDVNKKYLSAVTVTDSSIKDIWYFTPANDGFFRGSLLALTLIDNAFVTSYGARFYPYVAKTDYSPSSALNEIDIANRAIGSDSGNLFSGGSTYAEINSNLVEAYTRWHEAITTPLIPISGTLFWLFSSDIQGCVQYATQYDSNKNPVVKSTLSGNPRGYFGLNNSTRYVRLSTGNMTSWEHKLTPEEYDASLYVTNDIHKLQKCLSANKITDRGTTSWDFYNRSAVIKHDYVESEIQTYKSGIEKAGYDFVMPINTDLHTFDAEPFNMLKLMCESGVANVCFNLGDNLGRSLGDGETAAFGDLAAYREWSNSPMAKCPLIILRGNHDNNPVTGHVTDIAYTVSNKQFYNAMQERTQPGFAGVNKSYGFIDFEQPKIRVIFIDSGDIYDDNGVPLTSAFNVTIRQAQLDWFCNKALNFMDKSDRAQWSVITCSHAQLKQLAESTFNAILKAFIDGSTASGTETKSYLDTSKSETLTYNVDFTSQGSIEYICHVNGHNHYDYAFKMGTTNRYDIDICADSQTERGSYDGSTVTPYSWTAGTIEERCMDTLCLDKANRKIYMKRLGVGSDRTFDY